MKPCKPTTGAEADVDHAVVHYMEEATIDIAANFIADYDNALVHIGRFPGTGSPRYADTADYLGLRFWGLDRYPYAVFYIERDTFIEIVRVLHQSSVIPAHLSS